MDIVSISGAILSMISAAIAIWQAYRARRYRDEILLDRRKRLLIDVSGVARRAREECRKIVTPVGRPVRGVDQQHVINSIRDCLDRIKDNAHQFGTILDKALGEAEYQLGNYIQEQDESQRFSIGDMLYKALGVIIRIISEEIDREI